MKQLQLEQCPPLLRDYLFYMETIKGRSAGTVSEYFLDLRSFLRYIKLYKKSSAVDPDELETTLIDDIDLNFIKTISLSDVYAYLHFMLSQRNNSAKSRSRKVSSIRGFFKYLTNNQKLLEENPVLNLEVPSVKKALPKYLTLEQSLDLLQSVAMINSEDNPYKERDYCILTLFLNCGMRLSELVSINKDDIRDNTLRLLGKGNKERIIYLNQISLDSIRDHLKIRDQIKSNEKRALFISRNGNRISRRRVQEIVEHYLKLSGLGGMGYSVHKLRHTAATLMYQYGQIDIRVLKDILGHANLGTTEIYTHVSSSQMEQAADSNPLNSLKKPKK